MIDLANENAPAQAPPRLDEARRTIAYARFCAARQDLLAALVMMIAAHLPTEQIIVEVDGTNHAMKSLVRVFDAP